MNKRRILLSFLSLITLSTICQKSRYNYYIIGDKTQSGTILLKGSKYTNAKYCRIIQGDSVIKYSPYEMKEYGYTTGVVYKSFNISLEGKQERYFLERLAQGELDLYYLPTFNGNKFYMSLVDSLELIQVPTKSSKAKEFWSNYMVTCPEAMKDFKFVSSGKSSLKRFVNKYNTCSSTPFPRVQFGIRVGMAINTLSIWDKTNIHKKVKGNTQVSPTVGAFLEIPLATSNFSFMAEINYMKHSSTAECLEPHVEYVMEYDYSFINVPLLFRYSWLNTKITPYVQVGPVIAWTKQKSGDVWTYSLDNGEIYKTDQSDLDALNSNMTGIDFGCGLIKGYDSKVSFFLDLRYGNLFNTNTDKASSNFSQISLSFGLMF